MNVGTLTIFLGVTTSGINKAIRDANRLERSVVASAGTAQEALLSFGRVATQFLTFPLSIIGGVATKTFSDFEYNLAKVTGLVGIASDQTKEWGEELKDLASAVGKSPKELSEALYFVTTGGIRGAETMDVLTVAAKAAAAGLGETQQVADLLVSAMNAYGKENLSAARAADILVASVKEGKAEAPALAQSMGIVLPIASKLGVTFDQVGAAMAGMTRTGTKAATAAMQTRQILNKIVKPAEQSKEAIKKVGTSFEELRHIIGTQGLLPALMKLNDLTKEYGVDTMADIFPNIRALSGVLDLLGANLDENIKSQEAITNSAGALDHAFATVAKTWKFQLNQAIKEGQTLMVELGEVIAKTLTPTIKNIFDSISSLVSQFTNLTSAQQKTIVHIGLFATALGPVIILLNVLKASIIPVFTSLYLWFGKSLKELLLLDTAVNKYVGSIKRELVANEARINSATKYTAALVKQRLALLEASRASVKHSNAMLALMSKSALGQTTFAASTGSSLLMTKRFNTAMVQQGVTMVKVATKGAVANTIIRKIGASLLAAGKSAALAAGRFAMTSGYIAILALLGTALVGLIKKHKDASAAQEALNDTNKEAARIYAQEAQTLNKLASTVQSEYTSKDMRAQAIIRLNNMAPEYLRNLTEENARTEEGIKLIDDYRDALERKGKAQAANNALIELEQRRIEDLATGANKMLTFWERAEKVGTIQALTGRNFLYNMFGGAGYEALRVAQDEIDNINEKVKTSEAIYNSARDAYILMLNSSKYALSDFVKQYDLLSEKTKQAEKNDKMFAKTVISDIKMQMSAMDEYLTMLRESFGILKKQGEFEEMGDILIEIEGTQKIQSDMGALLTIMEALLPNLFDLEEYTESAIGKLDKLFEQLREDMSSARRGVILFGDSYDLINKQLSIYKTLLENASKLEGSTSDQRVKNAKLVYEFLLRTVKAMREMDSRLESMVKYNEDYIDSEAEKMMTMDDITQKLSIASAMYEHYQSQIDATKMGVGKLTLSFDVLKDVLEELSKYKHLLPEDLKKQLESMLSGTKTMEVSTIFTSMQDELDEVTYKAELFGNVFDGANKKVQILGSYLRRAMNINLTELELTNEEWAEYIANINRASDALHQAQAEQNALNVYADATASLFDQLGGALVNAENAFVIFGDHVIGILDSIINAALKAAIANNLASAPNLIVAAFAIGGLKALWNKYKDSMDSGIEMAKGGIVPPGYPNDSYPARLSSGEMVIPAKKLPQLQSKEIYVTMPKGTWEVEGRKLKYIIDEENRRFKNVY